MKAHYSHSLLALELRLADLRLPMHFIVTCANYDIDTLCDLAVKMPAQLADLDGFSTRSFEIGEKLLATFDLSYGSWPVTAPRPHGAPKISAKLYNALVDLADHAMTDEEHAPKSNLKAAQATLAAVATAAAAPRQRQLELMQKPRQARTSCEVTLELTGNRTDRRLRKALQAAGIESGKPVTRAAKRKLLRELTKQSPSKRELRRLQR